MGARQSRQSSSIPETITRQALGRIANLGDLYDATTDKFCGVSIFRKPLPSDFQARTDNPDSKIAYIKIRCLKEMFKELNVTSEMKLSVLAGMCELQGSAKYLSQKKTSFNSVENTMLYNVKTATERIQLFEDQVKRYLSREAIIRSGATHVVIEIEWGASFAVTVMDQNSENRNTQEVEGTIWLLFEKLKSFIWPSTTEQTGAGRTQEETGDLERFSLKIFGDVLPDDSHEFPQNFDGAVAMMRKMPQLLQKYNDGKGKQLAYVMFPVSRLPLRIPSKRLTAFRSVDDTRTIKVIRLFDKITDSRQKAYNKIEELNNRSDLVASSDLEEAHRLATELEDHEVSVKSELAQLLEKVRSAKEDAERLDTFCDEHYETAQKKFNEFERFSNAVEPRIAKPLRSTSRHLSLSALADISL